MTTEVTDRGLRRGTSSPTTVSKAGSSGTGDGTNPTGDESSPVVNMPPKWLNKISERSPAATSRCAGGNSRRESPSSTTVNTCVHQPTERGSMTSSRPWSSTSRVTRCGPHGSVARTARASADIRASRSLPPWPRRSMSSSAMAPATVNVSTAAVAATSSGLTSPAAIRARSSGWGGASVPRTIREPARGDVPSGSGSSRPLIVAMTICRISPMICIQLAASTAIWCATSSNIGPESVDTSAPARSTPARTSRFSARR